MVWKMIILNNYNCILIKTKDMRELVIIGFGTITSDTIVLNRGEETYKIQHLRNTIESNL